MIKLDIGLKGFQSTFLLTSLLFLGIAFLNFDIFNKLIAMLSISLFIILLIYIEINKYVKNFKDKILTILGIILGNISFALAGFIFLGIRSLIVDGIYILSRKK